MKNEKKSNNSNTYFLSVALFILLHFYYIFFAWKVIGIAVIKKSTPSLNELIL